MTENDKVGPCYSGTADPVRIGDAVLIDGHPGVVQAVMSPKSTGAKDYACYETGGLLLETKEFGLVVEPFGVSSRIVKDKEGTAAAPKTRTDVKSPDPTKP